VVADFDGNRGQELLQSFGLDPHVRTGSGGHHVYLTHPGWRVPTWNCKTNRTLGKRWPGLDIRGDGGYAVCGGRNEYGEYQWLRDPVLDPFDMLPPELQAFLRLSDHSGSPAPPDEETRMSGCGTVSASVLIDRALEQAPVTGRNNAGFWLATQIRDNAYAQIEAESIMIEYAARVPGVNLHGQPERYTREEAVRSLRQAYSRPARDPWRKYSGSAVRPSEAGFTPRTSGTSSRINLGVPSTVIVEPIHESPPNPGFFERSMAPREEIIEGILREKQLAAFAGPFTVGKSPLLADIIVHRVHGISWCGHKVPPGPVIIVDLENERGAWSRNVRNIALRLAVRPPKVPDEADVYLLNDAPSEPGTRLLLDALESKTRDGRFKLLEDALQSKPNALVIIDPGDILFPIKKNENTQILVLFRKLKQLLAGYPQAAIILTFNLRKQDRRTRRPNLLLAPRDWLEEIAGSLDLCNRSDVRIGMDFHDEAEGVRVINGVRRNEEMAPLLVRPVPLNDDPDTLAGFELAPVDAVGLSAILTSRQQEYWRELPGKWRFDEVADKIVPRATLFRMIRRLTSLALEEKDGVYRKLVD
jgi:hypothetical protein